jgi:hypothetical protein
VAYTEADRVQIRRYLGVASLYLQADPRLESAITASQSIADGGTRPDSSLETQIKADLAACAAVDAAIAATRQTMGATKVEEISLDTVREVALRKQEGAMYVGRIARALDVEVYVDPYFNAEVRLRPATTQFPYVRNPYT